MRQASLAMRDDTPPVERGGDPISDSAFRTGDRRKLLVGGKPLREYLEQSGQGFVVRLAQQIDQMDVSALLQSYSPLGRHALHPRVLLGLIIFGTLNGQSSLRELQDLATCDTRAWWLCGGEQPDHSTIGKFIIAHKAWLVGDGFVAAFKQATKGLRLQSGTAAMDGTVIEAVASRLNMLTKEAAREAAEEAERAAAESPNDDRAQQAAQLAQQVSEAAAERTEARKAKGRKADYLQVAASDPEAVTQPRKDDVRRPSYKPSVIATPEQLIAGQHVEPSSETAAVPNLIEQHRATLGEAPSTVLADAGYNAIGVLGFMAAREIDILCPEGSGGVLKDINRKGHFQKHLFVYQPRDDTYRCPASKTLKRISNGVDRDGRRHARYTCNECRGCPMRSKCTEAKTGRSIKRYEGEELKEAEREVMRQPAARAKYRARSAMVEPVFGRLRALGLTRFRRRGLVRVRAEFAIYCIAYNFKRADGMREARIAAFVVVRFQHAPTALVVMFASITFPTRY